ncbi:MAG: hypothetical protein ACTHJM_14820 [Marmoricola sp.]
MNPFKRAQRPTAAVAATAALLTLAAGTGSAFATEAPARTATTFTDGTYLQDALGLPASDTSPVIETVTYDRFQWLLKQTGKFAFLVGDPADANFKARAQDVEASAEAAGVKKVYWFDPNLSGSAKVGSTTEPNLDIRNPAGITSITAASQTIYGYTWTNLIAQYLGDGYKATITSDPDGQLAKGAEGGVITTALDSSISNDYGSNAGYSTEVGNTSGGALYDYTSGTDANATDDYFFIYNKDNTVTPSGGSAQPQKIVSWVDLSKEASSSSTQSDVTTAIGTVGAANLTELGQGAFWQSEANSKYAGSQPEPAANATAYTDAPGSDKVLSDADAADWRIQQITYPQLVHLLTSATSQNAIILFGGTWCPNTRAALESVNKYAIANGVKTVYNFDTVLDGGWVGGGTTSATDPLQVRNYTGAAGSSDPTNSNPTELYGDLITSYLANIETQYDPTLGTGFVSYYPGGNTAKSLKNVRKLQVPFLVGYQQGASSATPNGGITRQWIQQETDVNGLPYFNEYMSEPYFTHPQPFGIGLNIPHDAAIWSTIHSDLSTFTWKSNPAATALTSHYNTATDADDAHYLGSGDLATVTYNSSKGTVSAGFAAPGTAGATTISPAALQTALSALGANAPTTKSAAQAALLGAEQATTPDQTLIGNLSTVYGAYSVAQQRKTSILNAWNSVQFGLEAVAKLDSFFGGLPGGVVSTQTVTAKTVAYGTAPVISVAIANQYGRVPTGQVALTVKKGTTTVLTTSKPVTQSAASFTLPKWVPGSYTYTLSYAGDDQIASFTDNGTLTVARAKVSKISGATVTTPRTTATGRYRVTVATPTGLTHATGTVTIRVRKGSVVKTLTGRLTNGVVTITVPKLAKGTWTVGISYGGDARYLSASAAGPSLRVVR